MYAHVVGIPLEETTLGLTPVAVLAIGGLIARRRHVLGFLALISPRGSERRSR